MCNTSRHGIGVKDEAQVQQTNLQNTRTRRSGVLTVMDRPPGIIIKYCLFFLLNCRKFELFLVYYKFSTIHYIIIVSTT